MARTPQISLLLDNPMSVTQVARATQQTPNEAADGVAQLLFTLDPAVHEAAISSARCLHCRFDFPSEQLLKPAQCPRCQSKNVTEPLLQIRARHKVVRGRQPDKLEFRKALAKQIKR